MAIYQPPTSGAMRSRRRKLQSSTERGTSGTLGEVVACDVPWEGEGSAMCESELPLLELEGRSFQCLSFGKQLATQEHSVVMCCA